MTTCNEFHFTPDLLSKPRKPGISAYMRIKNGAEFVRLAILSHLKYYDEIIACYNDCSDNTETILRELQRQHPHKIKVYHYLPKVHPIRSLEHKNTPTDSVHSMANYSNYALSKTTYQVATKLDDDHLAIPQNLSRLTATVRADMAVGKQKLYPFSGINLIQEDDEIKVAQQKNYFFSGGGDIMYHPVNEKTCFYQHEEYEKFNRSALKGMERQYIGIMYFHLKYLKRNYGMENLPESVRLIHQRQLINEGWTLSFDEFCSSRYRKQLVRQLTRGNQMRYMIYKNQAAREILYKLTSYRPNWKVMRLIHLFNDLKHIDFEREVAKKITRQVSHR